MVSIGLSYAQSKDQDDTATKPTDYEINSQENKIEDGPFFFKINAKQANKPFTLPILEIPNLMALTKKTGWQIYNNEKTSKVEESRRNDEQKDRVDEFLKADD
ncbi:hypothetical protein LSTR_LSTR009717 [Laodelphax striatellus]|uniref:Uncharacterized protein n=1 Tax=Laodelphax striatellus TaxID=195883 RepID=A0A482WWB9_LAOST|nr:hypothetical protein LSTR_LSTR009717 [Laodelphax striatellus]